MFCVLLISSQLDGIRAESCDCFSDPWSLMFDWIGELQGNVTFMIYSILQIYD